MCENEITATTRVQDSHLYNRILHHDGIGIGKEKIAFIMPRRSGKTTFAKHLRDTGLRVLDDPSEEELEEMLRNVGMLDQVTVLFTPPPHPIGENMKSSLKNHGFMVKSFDASVFERELSWRLNK